MLSKFLNEIFIIYEHSKLNKKGNTKMIDTIASLLALSSTGVGILVGVLTLLIAIPVGMVLYRVINKQKHVKAETRARNIIQDALNEAKNVKREAILEAKDEVFKLKTSTETELKERKAELAKSENRLIQREDFINKKELLLENKLDGVEKTKAELSSQQEKLSQKLKEQEEVHQNMIAELERISGLSKENAKQQLIDGYVDEAKKDAVILMKQIETDAKENANKTAQEIISMAIQRCASDHSSEATVTSVALPNDEMKGRIIGREGRNIRALEAATGVDLIVDDTPEAVVLSCFEPVRREIARLSLEKLISDGRIHPTRIEETVEKVRRDMDVTIKEAGEAAAFEAGVHGLHPELIKVMGRLKYRTSYGQNVLKHSIEVAHLAGLMATELGANVNVAKRGGFLHDIGKGLDHEIEGTHVEIGVDLTTKYKESKQVIHCIAAHHGDVGFESIEAILVQAADAISSSRPGARRESLENYIKRLQKLEEIATETKGVDKAYAIQAGREIRIIVKPNEISDDTAVFLAKEVAEKIEKEMQYPGQIKVNVIRETRSVAYAK